MNDSISGGRFFVARKNLLLFYRINFGIGQIVYRTATERRKRSEARHLGYRSIALRSALLDDRTFAPLSTSMVAQADLC